MAMDVLYLPATDPADDTYGHPPESFPDDPTIRVFSVSYPRMVWYNEEIRAEALRQIEMMSADRVVLVGFSKSGLGAWHLAQALPECVKATIIFDAPMALQQLPSQWGAAPFYPSAEAWQRDLPVYGITQFQRDVSADHKLILISGAHFDADMRQLVSALNDAGIDHTFLPHPEIRHHWNAGWVEIGLAAAHITGAYR